MRSSSDDRNLTWQAIALIGVGVLLVGLLLGVVRLQTSMQLWLHAHHRWVQAETEAAAALEIYASTGDEAFLRRAQQALEIPLGARVARHAADRKPPDLEGVRRGLMQVGMEARDIDDMSWVYFRMRRWPFIKDAIDVWLRVEPDIDQLAAISRAIKTDADARRLTPVRVIAYRKEIAQIRQRVDGYTWEFANVLLTGLRVLRAALVVVAILLFVAFVVLFLYILRRFNSRIRSGASWLRASFDQANVGMLQLADDGGIRYANAAASRILGLGTGSCVGHKLQDFIVYRDQPRFLAAMRGETTDQPMEDGDLYLLLTADGRQQVIRAGITPVEEEGDGDGQAGMRFAMIEDVTEAHALRAELARQARYDELTGLFSRDELLRRIGHALMELKEGRIAHLSVCLIDLDRFRYINESVGLRVGDRILQIIAHRLEDAMGQAGQVGRLGGDQFVMLLPGMDSGDAMAFSARVAEALSRPDQELADGTMTPTTSMGVVSVDRLYTSASEILAAAAAACERAKQAGRNRVRLLMREEEAGDGRRSPAEWAAEIRRAMGEGRLELLGQRIASCRAGDAFEQVEVLLRLRDGGNQLIGPDRFLPVAEMYGLSMGIDRQVLLMAMEAMRGYRASGGKPMIFYINLSTSSVGDPDFAVDVRRMLDEAPELAPQLCFEITESGMIANLEQATVFMDMVRQRGCKVALDDFGTGQSSFSQLRVLPVDIVKIDGSFVRDIDQDASSEVLVRAICQMSHVLGKRTVVEWVERAEDARRMCALGADYMQGFGLHRPEPLASFLAAAGGARQAPPPRA